MENKSIVRLWDSHEGWIDVTGPLGEAEALEYWNKETHNGTVNAEYATGKDYYRIFPANTRMLFTPDYYHEDEDE